MTWPSDPGVGHDCATAERGSSMVTRSDAERLHDLIARLLAEPREQEWLEFKTNKAEPEEVGEYISALSNGAAIGDRDFGYLLWGVE